MSNISHLLTKALAPNLWTSSMYLLSEQVKLDLQVSVIEDELKKRLGRKGVHPSHSTIPIEDGDLEAVHKMCLKYASDADYASDDDTPVNLHAVVDWELLPTGLGWINVIYRKDNSRKCFTSLREILHLVTRADLMTIYGRVMTFYQDKKAVGIGLVLWGDLKVLMDSPEVNDGCDVWKNQQTWKIQSWKLYSYSGVHVLETVGGLVVHMFVDKKYPLSVNLIEQMLDQKLEICQDTVGNELTTAVQLIAFLKKQIADSRRPKVHDCPQLDADCLVADSKFMKVAFGVDFKILLFNPLVFSTKDLSRNLKLTVYVVPTGKDNVIVSAGRTKVIPAVLPQRPPTLIPPRSLFHIRYPHDLLVKLNYDAAFKNSNAAYVLGNPFHAISPLHAEIIVVHYACSLAFNRGWFNATVESDSQLPISLSSSDSLPSCLAALMDDIRL
ncbi:hypothetical protein Tco_0781699 [Tanacetum coccineum]